MAWLVQNKELAEALSYWAQVVALMAGLLAVIRYFHEKRVDRQGSARALYTAFMDASIAHPELYGGCWSDGSLSSKSERQKYIYYIGSFLWAAEELLREFPGDQAWRETVMVTLMEHEDYFMSDQFDTERNGYSDDLIQLINSKFQGSGMAPRQLPTSASPVQTSPQLPGRRLAVA